MVRIAEVIEIIKTKPSLLVYLNDDRRPTHVTCRHCALHTSLMCVCMHTRWCVYSERIFIYIPILTLYFIVRFQNQMLYSESH